MDPSALRSQPSSSSFLVAACLDGSSASLASWIHANINPVIDQIAMFPSSFPEIGVDSVPAPCSVVALPDGHCYQGVLKCEVLENIPLWLSLSVTSAPEVVSLIVFAVSPVSVRASEFLGRLSHAHDSGASTRRYHSYLGDVDACMSSASGVTSFALIRPYPPTPHTPHHAHARVHIPPPSVGW